MSDWLMLFPSHWSLDLLPIYVAENNQFAVTWYWKETFQDCVRAGWLPVLWNTYAPFCGKVMLDGGGSGHGKGFPPG